MSAVDEVDKLCSDIIYNYPAWPSTFSTCPHCKTGSARGNGLCALCLTVRLADKVGIQLAVGFHESVKHTAKVRDQIHEEAGKI